MRKPSPLIFDDVYREHADGVLRLVWLLGVSSAERRDVAQEVWISAFRSFDDAQPNKLRAWLAAITCKRVLSWRRARQRRPEFHTSADALEAPELPAEHTPETDMEGQRSREAARAFLFKAIPDDEKREALILHDGYRLTVDEVADHQNVPKSRVEWWLKLARKQLKEAVAKMSDKEREELRGAAVVFKSVDEVWEALRTKMPEQEINDVWQNVQKRIAVEGIPGPTQGGPDTGPSESPPHPPPLNPSPRPFLTLTGGQAAILAVALIGVGALAGALLPRALFSRTPHEAPAVADEMRAAPAPTADHVAELAPPVIATPSATVSATPAKISTSTAVVATSSVLADALLLRASKALRSGSAQDALSLAEEHARHFPGENAEREVIAIKALFQLGRRTEGEQRAAKLVTWAPQYRPSMEALSSRR